MIVNLQSYFFIFNKSIMKIIRITAGLLETNCYLIINPEARKALLIDSPPDSIDKVLETLRTEQAQLEAILLTHTHWDHFAEANPIKRSTGAKLYVHKNDYYRIQNPLEHTLMPLDFEIESAEADYLIGGQEELVFEAATLEAIPTPGHTEGGITYVLRSEGCAFVGDTIFYLSVGRTDLPGGNDEALTKSINEIILRLPDDYILYTGHDKPTTVGFEKSFNPYIITV